MFATDWKTKRRFKTKAYGEWLKEADAWLWLNRIIVSGKRAAAPYSLEIRLPQKIRGDLDNRVKAISDFLVSRGITPDDEHMQLLTVRRCPELDGDCWVMVEAA